MIETVEIYKGFVIRSYNTGRYVAKRAYMCGREKAPTKKLIKKWIDIYLNNPEKYLDDISLLEKQLEL